MNGRLAGGRSGWVRVLQIVTGVAVLRWVLGGILFVLGYRHVATLEVRGTALELRGERRFLGLSLGTSQLLVPLAALRRMVLVGRSARWALAVALLALVAAGATGATLFLWGVAGRQVSWIALGLGVVGLGIFLDLLAYLWVRRSIDQGWGTLEILGSGLRLRLGPVPLREAEALVSQAGRALQDLNKRG